MSQLACREKQGTDAGYQRHRRAKEPACPKCTEGHRVRSADRRAARTDREVAIDRWKTKRRVQRSRRIHKRGDE